METDTAAAGPYVKQFSVFLINRAGALLPTSGALDSCIRPIRVPLVNKGRSFSRPAALNFGSPSALLVRLRRFVRIVNNLSVF